MADRASMGEFGYALAAERDAAAAIRWATPIIVFGWIIVGIAAVVLVVGVVGAVAALGGGSGSASVGVAFGAVGIAAVVVLQAACVLMVGYYVRARSQWTRFAVGSALAED